MNTHFIQRFLRHTTTRTTEKYLSKDDSFAVKNAEQLNNIFNKTKSKKSEIEM